MRLRRKAQKTRMEMLPLMDVVFLLLVFFIYSMMAMAVHRSFTLSLPTSSTAHIDRSISLALTVMADGVLFLDKEPVSREDLPALLQQKQAAAKPRAANGTAQSTDTATAANDTTSEEIALQVFAEGSVSYQELFHVLDLVKTAGVKKISLQAGQAPTP